MIPTYIQHYSDAEKGTELERKELEISLGTVRDKTVREYRDSCSSDNSHTRTNTNTHTPSPPPPNKSRFYVFPLPHVPKHKLATKYREEKL